MKTRSPKSRKIDIFSKGLTHGFGPKMAIFPTFFFLGNIDQENVFDNILERKNTFLGYNNMKSKKSENWHFSKGDNLWFWSKNGNFCNFFFRQYSQRKCFSWYSRTKNSSVDYKNMKSKQSKFSHFSKGVNPWFRSKNGHFSTFFVLGIIGQENVFYNILVRKNTFLAYKNMKSKKSKNSHFSKGVNPWFWSYNGHFSNFFFNKEYRPGKRLLWYFKTKKHLSRL